MRRVLIALLCLAAPAFGHDAQPSYRLPGDPDTMVRRGPEVAPPRARVTADEAGNRAVRVENMPRSATRPAPQTRLTVTREVFVPVRRVYFPDPHWRLRIRHRDGDWDGDLVIGTPGLEFRHPAPVPDPRAPVPWTPGGG